MRFATAVLLVVLATPAHAWTPPSGGPSKMAKRVLDSLPDPKSVAIPREIEQRSRSGASRPADQVTPDSATLAPPPRPGCWEVQITALGDADRAHDLATQETSRLGVPVRVVVEDGLAKLRAGGGCLRSDEAYALRDRARDAGYSGAFVTPVR